VKHRQTFIHFAVRARDNVSRNHFADFASGGSACFDSGFDRADLPPHDGGYKPGVHFFPADKLDVGSFDHGIGGFNHRHQTAAFNHS